MNRYKKLIIEVKKFPESQEVMDKDDWFFITDGGEQIGILGDSAYARVLDESEYILVEKTTADEFNVVVDDVGQVYDPTDFISERDPGDENTNRRQRDNDRRKS